MLLKSGRKRSIAAMSLAILAMVACGSAGDRAAGKAKPVVIGSAPFSESQMVANMYAGALQNEGYQVTVRKGLGPREIYLPALEKGGPANGIDLVPEYVGPLLEFVNKSAGEASGNLDDSVAKLRTRLDAMGLTALDPSPASRVFSRDGAVSARDLVVLEDDKKLQTVDNLIPAIRKDVLDDDIRTTLNKVSAALTTDDLIQLNKRADVDKTDPEALAREWLQQHGFTKKK